MKDIAHLRKSYERAELHEAHSAGSPLEQFERWLDEALKAQVPEPTAMTLATVGPHGRPSTRIVLLKVCDARGFVWYTNYESRKARELAANPQAALQFHWVELERVVRIEGRVEKTSAEESDAYFRTRPLDSRIGAWASPQSRVIASRVVLVTRSGANRGEVPARSAAPAALGRLPARTRRVRILAGPAEPPARPPALRAAGVTARGWRNACARRRRRSRQRGDPLVRAAQPVGHVACQVLEDGNLEQWRLVRDPAEILCFQNATADLGVGVNGRALRVLWPSNAISPNSMPGPSDAMR